MWRAATSLTYLHHLAQFCQVSGDEVEEGEFVKVLGPLVAHFHHLVVSLEQCCLPQSLPTAALIQGLGSLQSHLGGKDEEFRDRSSMCSSECSLSKNKVLKARGSKLVSPQCCHTPEPS